MNKRASFNRLHDFIKEYAERRNLRNTIAALSLAMKYHEGQFRDDGEPYIMHPMRVCVTLILLRVDEAFRKTYPKKGKEWIWHACDIMYATALLHDAIEEAHLPREGKEFTQVYHLDREVRKNVRILTKPPKKKRWIWSQVYNPDRYYRKIRKSLIAAIVKISDRKDNCTTFGVFPTQRKKKYIVENYEYIYPLIKGVKKKHSEFVPIIEVLEGIIKREVRPYEYLLKNDNETGLTSKGVNTC